METARAQSIHVLAFTSHNELLLCESEGTFSPSEWENVLQVGESICCQDTVSGDDTPMKDGYDAKSVGSFMRSVLQLKAAEEAYHR